MKAKLSNPGFEFIFALGILMVLVLPPVVMAQVHKEINVTINNGDTTINGKNIKDLSIAERKDALKDMEQLDKSITLTVAGKGSKTLTFIRHQNNNDGKEMIVRDDDNDNRTPIAHFYNFKRDSANSIAFHNERLPRERQKIAFNDAPDAGGPRSWSFDHGRDDFRGNRRNSQSFSYANTNNDGISTHVNFNIGDVNREALKRISGADKVELTINDLNIAPQFSTGKTLMSFALPEKGNAEIAFKDSEGKTLWTDKTTGSFTKSFELPQNGIYYLQVKQNGKLALRRIIKE